MSRDDLPEAERHALEAHLSSCQRCGELYGSMDLPATLAAPLAIELTRAILDRTSGSSCARAESGICQLIDDDADPVERELLELHLHSCEACAQLVPVLRRLGDELPSFATLAPGPQFVDDVIAVTSARPAAWPERLRAGWKRWLMRPRAAWELGYVGAMLLWLVFAAPISPVRGAPARTIEMLREPVQAIGATERGWTDGMRATSQQVWQATRDIAGESLHRWGSDLKQRYRASGATALKIGSRGLELGTDSIDRALGVLVPADSTDASHEFNRSDESERPDGSEGPDLENDPSIFSEGDDDASNE
jgi:hypothetical protein